MDLRIAIVNNNQYLICIGLSRAMAIFLNCLKAKYYFTIIKQHIGSISTISFYKFSLLIYYYGDIK